MSKKSIISLAAGGLILLPALFSGCQNTVTKYLYQKPMATVYDTSGAFIADMEEVNYATHVIYVYMPASEFVYKTAATLPFVTSAYASHKESHRLKSLETITDLRIITLNSYNGVFAAGTNIADSCEFMLHSQSDSTNYVAISKRGLSKRAIIDQLNAKDNDPYGYNYYSPASPVKTFSFRVKMPPATTGVQQFAIEFETKTPSRFADTTTKFILKP